MVATEAVVGAEVGGSDSDRCSAVRAEAANTLMNLSSCCQPCVEFSPRFFHYKNISLTVVVLLLQFYSLLLQLLLLCVSVSVSFCICCASAHCLHRSFAAQPVFLSFSLTLALPLVPRPVSLSLAFFCLSIFRSWLQFPWPFCVCALSSALVCSCSYPCCTFASSFGLFFNFPSQFSFAGTAAQTYSLRSSRSSFSLQSYTAQHPQSTQHPHIIHTQSTGR